MFEITSPHKNPIVVESPILLGAGAAGFDGAPYRKMMALDKFGALFTSPVTFKPRAPANGPRVVPLDAGLLLHTGLPNPGTRRVIRDYQGGWARSVLPIIVHVAASDPEEVAQSLRALDACREISGIELGLHDLAVEREVQEIMRAAKQNTDLPILVRLPLYNALELSEVAQRNEANALVVAGPPRGTERDQRLGRLVGGRTYGPWLKAQTLRVAGQVVQYASIPVIGNGGVHSVNDARDFLIAGVVAVQLDSVVWIAPKQAEAIADAFAGVEQTRTSKVVSQEWEHRTGNMQLPKAPIQPANPPEMPPSDEDITAQSNAADL